ncbi:hypothetical protein XELAEV_18046653mg [Xenopus laevis]|uniref:Protein kinase domain-containing protein n=1 Tax=Xenopus laevis TaxID=8355 RepID=A0A974BTY3_XENLA|nr:hypothetical protein XELAEV_18046653mg [Xenopus laevis]
MERRPHLDLVKDGGLLRNTEEIPQTSLVKSAAQCSHKEGGRGPVAPRIIKIRRNFNREEIKVEGRVKKRKWRNVPETGNIEEKKKEDEISKSSKVTAASEEGGGEAKRPRVAGTRSFPLQISSYRLHEELGKGAFGKVMLASLADSSERVAIKIIEKEDQNKELIEREARVLEAARGCPYLCQLHAAFQTEREVFLVMEHIRGGSLLDAITKGPLRMDTLICYAAEMVCGLQHLHAKGIVHRDIKPVNVLMTGKDHIKIIDFGIAAENLFGQSTTSCSHGTDLYLAPEVLMKKTYDAGMDWWALGHTLFSLVTCRMPFYSGADKEQRINSILHDPPAFPMCMNSRLKDLLQKLLEKDPEKRLGVHGNIREHPLFRNIDWTAVESQKL